MILFIYLLIINFISIIVTIYDKNSARKNKWRVKETTLFLLSFLGGSVGMYATMKAIHHKTKHKRFMIGIPLIFVFELVVGILLVIIYEQTVGF